MFKNPFVKGAAWLVLVLLGIWIFTESRKPPDVVAAALKAVPADCQVTGVWRREDYPPRVEHMKNTTIMCTAPGGRFVWTVYDASKDEKAFPPYAVEIDDAGHSPSTLADVYTVNPDGSLTISDEEGEYITLAPTPH